MDLALFCLIGFCGVSLALVSFTAAVTTALALLIVLYAQRAANRHLAGKPQILRRLRQRLLLGMSAGVILEAVFKVIFLWIVYTPLNVYLLGINASEDDPMSDIFNSSLSTWEEFLLNHPIGEWGWGAIIEVAANLPHLVTSLITPWILTLDYTQITFVHVHVEEVTREILVKDIVAFAAAGASGMRISYVLVWWIRSLYSSNSGLNEKSWRPVRILRQTAFDLMLMLRTSIVIIICQMAFCIAAAERDVLERKRRIWIAFGYCLAVSLPFYYVDIILAAAPSLERLPLLLRKLIETALAVGLLEHLRRRYCRLLSAARLSDAENVMLPAKFGSKAA